MKFFHKSVDNKKLFDVIKRGDIEKFRNYKKRGIDINIRNEDRDTLLLVASRHGHLEIVKELIQAGVDVNICDKHGDTPLHLACCGGGVDNLALFLWQNGAKCDSRNTKGEIPLHHACMHGRTSLVSYLVMGCDINLQCNNGFTPLMRAALSHPQIVPLLLKARANPNVVNYFGNTALLLACRSGNLKVVEHLLKSGADSNLSNGDSPLQIAVNGNHTEIVELLINWSANRSFRNTLNQTEPDLARERQECVEYLDNENENESSSSLLQTPPPIARSDDNMSTEFSCESYLVKLDKKFPSMTPINGVVLEESF